MSNFFEKLKSEEAGQSLIEILIALTIGAILIGAASTAVVTVLQSGTTSQRQQTSTVLAQDYIEKVRSFTSSDWHNLYNLEKTTSTVYQFQASSSQTVAVEGKEGIIDNDIRGGLVGYWSLDEASSTVVHDKSGNGNNGTINGATATSTDNCRVGRCYNFDGSDDYIDVDESNMSDLSEMSVSLWMYSDVGHGDGNHRGVIDSTQSNWDNPGFNIYLRLRSGDTGAGYSFNVDQANSGARISSSTVESNTWTHLVGTYDGSDIKLYKNGLLLGSVNAPGGNAAMDSLKIGRISSASGLDYHDGKIDDVRIYNRALTSGDIEHLHNSAVFERYFYVENVCRTNDEDYELAGTHPCDPGEIDDPSTQKVTVVVEWGDGGEFIVDDHITRWRNRIFPQTDWSGGPGAEGPFTEPTNTYSTSTDIEASQDGSIKVEGI